MRAKLAALIIAALAASGCALTPEGLEGDYPPVTPQDVTEGKPYPKRIRWGGTIVSTEPEEERTCLDILARPLNLRAQPREGDRTLGRFRACQPGFMDPEVYAEGRQITVVGQIRELTQVIVGDYELTVPSVDAENIHLWREERRYGYPYYYGPHYYPYHYPFYGIHHRGFIHHPFYW